MAALAPAVPGCSGAELAQLERSQQLTRLPIATEYIRRSGLNRSQNARPPGSASCRMERPTST